MESSRPLTPVLVTGLGRSGTTLLMRLLATSRAVGTETAYPLEFKYLHYFRVLSRTVDARVWDGERWSKWMLEFAAADQNAAGGLVGPPPWLERGLVEPRAGEEPFGDRVFEAIWTAFSDRVRDRAAQRYGGAGPAPVYWAEKSLGAASLELPETVPTKTVNAVRDPRDQWLSVLAWTRRRGHEAGAADDSREAQQAHLRQFFASEARRLAQVAEALDAGDPDTIVVRYEDLILDGARETARLAEFLGAELDASELERIDPGHGTSSSPAGSIGQGRTELAAEDQAWITETLGEAMGYFGYGDAPLGARESPREAPGRGVERLGDAGALGSPPASSREGRDGASIGGLERLERFAGYSIAARLVGGLEVLDVGCGTGEGTAALLEGGAERVVGVDGDEVALAAARLRAPGAEIVEATPAALPFANTAFDAVICIGSLPARGGEETLLEVRRVLRDHGVLVLSAPNAAIEPSPGRPAADDWLPAELIDALSKRFRNVTVLRQHDWLASWIVGDDPQGERTGDATLVPLQAARAGDERHTVVIASDAPLPDRRLSVVALAGVDLGGVVSQLRDAELTNVRLRRELRERDSERARKPRGRPRLDAVLRSRPRVKRLVDAIATRFSGHPRL